MLKLLDWLYHNRLCHQHCHQKDLLLRLHVLQKHRRVNQRKMETRIASSGPVCANTARMDMEQSTDHSDTQPTSLQRQLKFAVSLSRTWPKRLRGGRVMLPACVAPSQPQDALIPKTIGNRKRDCAWGCARGINTTGENLQIAKHKSVRWAKRTPSWFVLCRFSRVVFIHRVQPHAQSLFLFPIVFGINLIHFFDGNNNRPTWESENKEGEFFWQRKVRTDCEFQRHNGEGWDGKCEGWNEKCELLARESVNSSPSANFWQGKVHEDESSPNKQCSILSDRHWGEPSQSTKGPICFSYTVFHDPAGRSSESILSDDRPAGPWNTV